VTPWAVQPRVFSAAVPDQKVEADRYLVIDKLKTGWKRPALVLHVDAGSVAEEEDELHERPVTRPCGQEHLTAVHVCFRKRFLTERQARGLATMEGHQRFALLEKRTISIEVEVLPSDELLLAVARIALDGAGQGLSRLESRRFMNLDKPNRRIEMGPPGSANHGSAQL